MTAYPGRNGRLVLTAGMLLALVLGSLHAFSVFLEPLEAEFNVVRSLVSHTYSLALASLTVAVLFGHILYARIKPVATSLLICLVGAVGCGLAATAGSLPVIWIGYGLLFGGANGLGYGFALQISAQANPDRKGLAMGLVTAAYALGAVIAPLPFELLLRTAGFTAAMAGLAVALAVIAPPVAWLLSKADARLKVANAAKQRIGRPHRMIVCKLWLGYGTAAAAGLMAIGHATGIARAAGLSDWQVVSAPIAIASCNMLGSLLGGRLTDLAGSRSMLMFFPALSAVVLLFLTWASTGPVVLVGLAAVGFSYGAVITVYPVAVATIFGSETGVRIYGVVFTAWGTAGLLAPWFASRLYESSGNYQAALAAAGSTGLVSLLVAGTIRPLASADR